MIFQEKNWNIGQFVSICWFQTAMKMLPGSFRNLLGTYFYILLSFLLIIANFADYIRHKFSVIFYERVIFMDLHYFYAVRIRIKALCWINWILAKYSHFFICKIIVHQVKAPAIFVLYQTSSFQTKHIYLRKCFKAFSLFQIFFTNFRKDLDARI
jgi:hypothetical protein